MSREVPFELSYLRALGKPSGPEHGSDFSQLLFANGRPDERNEAPGSGDTLARIAQLLHRLSEHPYSLRGRVDPALFDVHPVPEDEGDDSEELGGVQAGVVDVGFDPLPVEEPGVPLRHNRVEDLRDDLLPLLSHPRRNRRTEALLLPECDLLGYETLLHSHLLEDILGLPVVHLQT